MPTLGDLFLRSAFRRGADRTLEVAPTSAESGSGLPDWWVVDEENLTVTITGKTEFRAPPGTDETVRIVGDVDSTADALVVTNSDADGPGQFPSAVDPFGYFIGGGTQCGGSDNQQVLKAERFPDVGPYTREVARVGIRGETFTGYKVDKDGHFLYVVEDVTVFKIDASDGTVHIKTGGTIVADL